MEKQPLNLYKDDIQSSTVVEWSEQKLQHKQREYLMLHNDEDLLPRQREQVNRILGRYIFEMYSRGKDRISMAQKIKGVEHELSNNHQ